MLKMNFAIPAVGLILAAAAYGAEPNRVPVLLELFTSEGCSSCPPADQLVEKLDRNQPVAGAELIVLSEHVDYWNRLGWTDPYSSSEFSRRQQAYATQFRTDDIYTPQLVIDGGKQVVGGNWPMAARAIQESLRERKIPVTLRAARSGNGAVVHIEAPPLESGRGLVYLALAANHAKSRVTRGENGGRELTHVAVVLSLTQVARISAKEGISKDVPVTFDKTDVRLVVFVQDVRTQRVLGAAQFRVEPAIRSATLPSDQRAWRASPECSKPRQSPVLAEQPLPRTSAGRMTGRQTRAGG
jgi:hypothetical protein